MRYIPVLWVTVIHTEALWVDNSPNIHKSLVIMVEAACCRVVLILDQRITVFER